MALRSRTRKKSRAVSTSASVQPVEQSRSLSPSVDRDSNPLPNIQTQLERAQRFGHHLGNHRDSTQQPAPPLIQPKLTIGAPGDKYEQEADRVAQQVVQQLNTSQAGQASSNQSLQRESVPEDEELQMKPEISQLQRQESAAEDEELQMKFLVQRQGNVSEDEASPDLEASIQQARGSGQRLNEDLQQKMGQAMGADFSEVRVHTNAQSDLLNQSIQAKAFTTKQDIFFRKGAYNPNSPDGQKLIAHELTHVVQQRHGEGSTALAKRDTKAENARSPAKSDLQRINRNVNILQRELDVKAPLKAKDIGSVSQVKDKLVFILVDAKNPTKKLVLKFDQAGNAEDAQEFRSRANVTNRLSTKVLTAAPGSQGLNKDEIKVLKGLKSKLFTENEAFTNLMGVIREYDTQKYAGKKMEHTDVGESLQDMADLKTIKREPGGSFTTAAQRALTRNIQIWQTLGETAAFDLFVRNHDRFYEDGTVNLENLDLAGIEGSGGLKQLDHVDRTMSLQNMQDPELDLHRVPKALKSGGEMAFTVKAVEALMKQLKIPADDKMVYSANFLAGFQATRAKIIAERPDLEKGVQSGGGGAPFMTHLISIIDEMTGT
jgi:hypothetical protein